jgi:hypothetical protein
MDIKDRDVGSHGLDVRLCSFQEMGSQIKHPVSMRGKLGGNVLGSLKAIMPVNDWEHNDIRKFEVIVFQKIPLWLKTMPSASRASLEALSPDPYRL